MDTWKTECDRQQNAGTDVLLQDRVYHVQEGKTDGHIAFSLTALIDRRHYRDCKGRRSVAVDAFREAERSRRDWP